jgi:hypothetical protein
LATFAGRVQDDIFEYEKKNSFIKLEVFKFSSIFSSDVYVSERQAQALANYIRANGTTVLRQARSVFLWNNLTHSIIVNN